MARTGVILAAGFGSRLAAENPDSIKPLTQVAGRPLMLRTLASLRRAGCDRVVVVVGYRGELIREQVSRAYDGPLELAFVTNERFDLANGVSVLAARPHVPGEFVLTMADHVFGDEVMDVAATAAPPDGGATLLVDRKLAEVFDMDDATKVRTTDGLIREIGKQLSDFDAVDTGLFVCTHGLFDALQSELDARGDASLSDGMKRLADGGLASVTDVGPGRWQDVDTPEMLAQAERVFGGDS